MASRPILINGFPRSGTTYLFDYLQWYENNYGKKRRVLLEPIFDLRRSAWIIHKGKAREKVLGKEHYSLMGITLRYKWPQNLYIYDERDVKFFLEKLKGYPMKTVNLHLYLDLAKENWEVYHIIRHPASVYLSVKSFFFKKPLLLNIYDVLRFLPIPDIHPYYLSARLFLISEKGISVKIRNFLEAFTVVWTFTNRYAIRSVKENLLIYNKEETLYKLPKFEEYVKHRRFRPRTYGNEAKILRTMREVATKYHFREEFDELVSLFG